MTTEWRSPVEYRPVEKTRLYRLARDLRDHVGIWAVEGTYGNSGTAYSAARRLREYRGLYEWEWLTGHRFETTVQRQKDPETGEWLDKWEVYVRCVPGTPAPPPKGRTDFQSVSERLRGHPGTWGVVAVYERSQSAYNSAYRIRKGLSVLGEDGYRVEAVVRQDAPDDAAEEPGEETGRGAPRWKVYARYVPEDTADPDAEAGGEA